MVMGKVKITKNSGFKAPSCLAERSLAPVLSSYKVRLTAARGLDAYGDAGTGALIGRLYIIILGVRVTSNVGRTTTNLTNSIVKVRGFQHNPCCCKTLKEQL